MILETWRSLLGRWTREVFDKDPKMTYLNLLRFNCKVCSRMISYNQFRGLQFHLWVDQQTSTTTSRRSVQFFKSGIIRRQKKPLASIYSCQNQLHSGVKLLYRKISSSQTNETISTNLSINNLMAAKTTTWTFQVFEVRAAVSMEQKRSPCLSVKWRWRRKMVQLW